MKFFVNQLTTRKREANANAFIFTSRSIGTKIIQIFFEENLLFDCSYIEENTHQHLMLLQLKNLDIFSELIRFLLFHLYQLTKTPNNDRNKNSLELPEIDLNNNNSQVHPKCNMDLLKLIDDYLEHHVIRINFDNKHVYINEEFREREIESLRFTFEKQCRCESLEEIQRRFLGYNIEYSHNKNNQNNI